MSLGGGGKTLELRPFRHFAQLFKKTTTFLKSFSITDASTILNRTYGFTLAEVLITLTIIGVVAALTLPNIIAKYKEKATVTAVKKNYSLFSQALLMVANEYGSLAALAETWQPGMSSGNQILKENANNTINALSKYMKVLRTCDKDQNCMPDIYKSLDGSKSYNWETFSNLQTGILANGTSFWILNNCGEGSHDSDNTLTTDYCVQIGFDINGRQKPNVLGEDFFRLVVDRQGRIVITSAFKEDESYLCNKGSRAHYNGYGCTYWILTHENMDYPNSPTDDD